MNAIAVHVIDIKLDRDLAFGLIFEENCLKRHSKLMIVVDSSGAALAATGYKCVSAVTYATMKLLTLTQSNTA